MLVLLAVFGLIYGGSEQAREKIVDQLQYLIDPSGLKVIRDIANNAAQPKAGILAAVIGPLRIDLRKDANSVLPLADRTIGNNG
jgi:uncharacterized BrkB/YihY/UPF0761 family membrane protein